jgi:hypothetical protein
MQLSPTRFVKIEGTEVTVAVNSPYEAKAAIKELRHKKKEFNWLKKAILKEIRAIEALKKKAGRARPRSRTWLERAKSIVDEFKSGPALLRASVAAADLPAMKRERKKIDDILHNLDSALLQIEGRLLHHL